MSDAALSLADVLRGRWTWTDDSLSSRPHPCRNVRLVVIVVAFGMAYGAMMGTFSGVWGWRLLQMLYGGLKVPLLLLATFLVALPSFWVLNRLAGLGGDFPRVLRGLVATQATLTLVLASLGPFTLLWYLSDGNYSRAILFNGAMFALASLAAQWQLRRYYRSLILRNPRHRWMQRLWLLIYCFVGIQMGWTLRPFIGDPAAPIQFFREGAFSNAYVVVTHLLLSAVR